jgi:ubiquinone/menaquinone biosynthesis C-methylase UbiE
MTVNLWTDSAHARDYLERRRRIPHRDEGYAALLQFLPPAPRRVLDLGTGDGYLFALIRDHHPDVTGLAADFSNEMLDRAPRERTVGP